MMAFIGRADFMAHVGEEIGLHLGGVFGHFLGAAQFLLDSFQSLIAGFEFLLAGNDLPFGGRE